jgi:hypothetical protein
VGVVGSDCQNSSILFVDIYERAKMTLMRTFWGSMWSPGPRGHIWTETTSSTRIRHWPTLPGPPRTCFGPWQIGCYICQTWTYWTSLYKAFCKRKSRWGFMPIWLQWNQWSLASICRTGHSFCHF